ncbi:hypothetical protein HDU83_008161 [Entophlyctis luteolus]|nr:hypothetical protein HDU82_006035 [Entophlyctis luteolus]KAJ3338487.1 hypothetical protein HDU83_008161 [Entophlyctis luteolus]KAJ3377481.1 hypothetical protein HDU84_008607 [Entophlyctis sp. JEL0112]
MVQAHHSLNHARAYAAGHKKALLIGINYRGSDHELKGCIADVQLGVVSRYFEPAVNRTRRRMKQFLISHRGYTDAAHAMVFMSDDAVDSHHKPNLKNMVAAFQWLVTGNKEGDNLFLHYSGHGAQSKSKISGAMVDCLVPLDYQSAGCIDADFLHRCIVHALPAGVKLTVVMDCCHSGTMLELPYTYRPSAEDGSMTKKDQLQKVVEDVTSLFARGLNFNSVLSSLGDVHGLLADVAELGGLFPHRSDVDVHGYKHEHFAESVDGDAEEKSVVVISGCRDDQTSADTVVQGYGSTGALSYAIMSKLKESDSVTYDGLLKHARSFMEQNKLTQIPQLSCGMEVEPTGSFEF